MIFSRFHIDPPIFLSVTVDLTHRLTTAYLRIRAPHGEVSTAIEYHASLKGQDIRRALGTLKHLIEEEQPSVLTRVNFKEIGQGWSVEYATWVEEQAKALAVTT